VHWYQGHPHWWKPLVDTDDYRAYYRRVYGQDHTFLEAETAGERAGGPAARGRRSRRWGARPSGPQPPPTTAGPL
jgi:hypothetical protein